MVCPFGISVSVKVVKGAATNPAFTHSESGFKLRCTLKPFTLGSLFSHESVTASAVTLVAFKWLGLSSPHAVAVVRLDMAKNKTIGPFADLRHLIDSSSLPFTLTH